jgi:hypothetical protein
VGSVRLDAIDVQARPHPDGVERPQDLVGHRSENERATGHLGAFGEHDEDGGACFVTAFEVCEVERDDAPVGHRTRKHALDLPAGGAVEFADETEGRPMRDAAPFEAHVSVSPRASAVRP